MQRHNLTASIEKFRKQVREHPNNAYDYYLLAESLEQKGAPVGSQDYREALHASERAVALDPKLTLAREVLANLYLTAGDIAKSTAQCEIVLKSNPENREALYHLILALRKSDRKAEVPGLTKRLLSGRNAQTNRDAEKTRYELVDDVDRVSGSVGASQRN
jgi:tetratricopeptide (TPR) repeat protein